MRADLVGLCFVGCSLLAGCVVSMPVAAGARGRVLDEADHRPLQGAGVSVKAAPKVRTVTASDGSFSLAATSRLCFVLAPTCRNGPVRSVLVIEKPGYERIEFPVVDGDKKPLLIFARAIQR